MAKFDFVFVAPNYGRSITDDNWEVTDQAYIELWKMAVRLLSTRNISTQGKRFSVQIDWEPILRRHQRSYDVMKKLEMKKHSSLEEAYKEARFPRRPSKSRMTVITTQNQVASGGFNMAQHVTECMLHDVFLIMNIAAPASCDFYRAFLVSQTEHRLDVSLSNVYFESSLLVQTDRGWPPCKFLNLPKVISWFDSVRQGPSQVPQNPMERALFALLHISRMNTSPMIVIWLFYAFESLLQTSAGENFNAIVRRLALLLDADEKAVKEIRKEMRALYDIRSSIVHGGFEVAHPSHNEILDKRVDDNYGRVLNAATLGHALLVCAIQCTIENGWRFPKFEEKLSGESYPPVSAA
jgi:hypothetical protein